MRFDKTLNRLLFVTLNKFQNMQPNTFSSQNDTFDGDGHCLILIHIDFKEFSNNQN